MASKKQNARQAKMREDNKRRVEGLEEAKAIINSIAGDWPNKACEDACFLMDQIQHRIDQIKARNYLEPYYMDRVKRARGNTLDFIILDDPLKEP